ncbi:hypothetical protein GOP47_0014481 [Adiantum capillus-veneris]|uniref:Sulfite exporter TauE/SafE family protein n=1 Tax=Adiantum capillus-veneris TaxID=13818 RepID=A0A9D4ULK1_ADICA|nr:hypothetical protein GOP47_0014481 [Adiantum capillus-veneris]
MEDTIPLRLFLSLMIVLYFGRIGVMCANSTTYAGSEVEVWDARYFSPNYLVQTDSELQTWRIVTAVICGAIAAALSSAGGLGGGGLYVPIFNLLLGFNSKTSAALSSCMILGGTLVNLFWYCFQRRVDGLGPLIDYQVSLLCLPNVLLGIGAGVFCNVASPSWLVTVVLIVVLFFMTFRSSCNACQRWNHETRALQSASVSSAPVKENACDVVVAAPLCDSHDEKYGDGNGKNEELKKPLLERLGVEGLPQYPPLKIAMLCTIWVAFLAVQIVRGSSDGENLFGIQTCGVIYWLVTLVQVPFAFVVTTCTIIYFQRKSLDQKDGENPSPQEEPMRGGLVKMRWLPVYALGAGFLGGMLGLGGGTIISPLLLETGMHPQVTAATCSFMVFFSSSLSVVQFWLLGRIPEEYALISAALSLVFSVIGLQVVQTIIIKYGRVSLIVFAVSIVMGISAVLMALFGTWDVVIQVRQGEYMGFRSPC